MNTEELRRQAQMEYDMYRRTGINPYKTWQSEEDGAHELVVELQKVRGLIRIAIAVCASILWVLFFLLKAVQ